MEHYINIIFNKNITLGKIEETVNSVVSNGGVPLNEDGLEYEIYKQNTKLGISIPLSSHVRKDKIEEYVNLLANKLFDKGFDNFDIELSLNEEDANNGPTEFTGDDALQQFSQSDERGIANNPEQRAAIRQLQQRLMDLGYDLGPMGADGIYGRRTIAAVRAYQEANNLTADGDAGPETIGHMLRGATTTPPVPGGGEPTAEPTAEPTQPQQPRYYIAILKNDNGESYVVMDRTTNQPVQDERGNNRTFPNRDEAEALATQLNGGTTTTPSTEQPPAPGEDDNQQPSNEQPPASPSAFRVRGDLIVGRDSITLEDGRTINKQWELRISDRRLRFVRSTSEYRNAYVGRVNGEERVFVYSLSRNRYVALQAGYTNLIQAMREHVPNFDQRIDAEAAGTGEQGESPNTTPQQPYTRNGDNVTGTDTIETNVTNTWNWTIAISERTVTVSLRNRRLVMYDVYINSDGRIAGTKIVDNRSVNTMLLSNFTNLSRAFLEFVRDPRVRPENTTNARIQTTQLATSDNPQAVAGAERIEQGRRDNDPDAIAQGVEIVVAAQPNVATPEERAERAEQLMATLTATELQNPRIRAALASQQLAVDMNDARNDDDREQGLRRYVRSIYQTVVPERFRDSATTQQRFEAIVRRAQDEGMMSAFVDPTRATDIIQDEVNRLSGEGTPPPARPDLDATTVPTSPNSRTDSDPTSVQAATPTRSREGDGGLALAREARAISREIYTNLGNAITGANTDEEAIQAALQRIEDEDMWNTVTGTYANRYPKPNRNNLRTGELLGDLRGAMSRRDWRRYVQPELERLGIEEEYDVPTTNESVNIMKINDIVDEETYDGDDFYEAYGDLWYNDDEVIDEAEYRGRKVKLGKPMKGDVKKFKVYVKNPKGNIVKVNFGDPNMRIKKSNPARRRSFRARHNCDNPGPRHKARYWSCRKW